MKNFTIIPNELFDEFPLSISEKYLLCVLIKFCGQKDSCFPSQKTLANILGFKSERQIRKLLNSIENKGYIKRKRQGFNKTNRYTVFKEFFKYSDRNSSSCIPKNSNSSTSYHTGTDNSHHTGIEIPTKITYIKLKDKTNINKQMGKLKKSMIDMGIYKRK